MNEYLMDGKLSPALDPDSTSELTNGFRLSSPRTLDSARNTQTWHMEGNLFAISRPRHKDKTHCILAFRVHGLLGERQ
jgi:hypothetical protein